LKREDSITYPGMFSSQLEKITEGTGYGGLQKVYSIWICLGKDIPENDQQTITRFYVAKEEVIGNAQSKPEDYDLMELVILRLGDKETEHYHFGNADYIVLEENVGKKTNDRAGRNLWNTHETKIEGGGRTYVHI